MRIRIALGLSLFIVGAGVLYCHARAPEPAPIEEVAPGEISDHVGQLLANDEIVAQAVKEMNEEAKEAEEERVITEWERAAEYVPWPVTEAGEERELSIRPTCAFIIQDADFRTCFHDSPENMEIYRRHLKSLGMTYTEERLEK